MNTHSIFESVFAQQTASALNIHGTVSITAGASTYQAMDVWKHASWLVTLATTTSDKINHIVVKQATDSAGTSAKAVSGFTFRPTTLDVAGESAVIEFDAENLDYANGFTHVCLEVGASGGSAGTVSIVRIMSQQRY